MPLAAGGRKIAAVMQLRSVVMATTQVRASAAADGRTALRVRAVGAVAAEVVAGEAEALEVAAVSGDNVGKSRKLTGRAGGFECQQRLPAVFDGRFC